MARYSDAIYWITINDDTQWLDDMNEDRSGASMSVTAALVQDLFGKTEEQVIQDLNKEHKRQFPNGKYT